MKSLILILLILISPIIVLAQGDGGGNMTYEILSTVLTIVVMLVGAYYKKEKDKVARIANLKTNQLRDLVQSGTGAVEDNRVTSEEIKNIRALAKELGNFDFGSKESVDAEDKKDREAKKAAKG